MTRMTVILFFGLAITTSFADEAAEDAAVMAVIDTFFSSMTEKDTASMRKIMTEDGVIYGYRDSDAADIDALIANILCIAQYACDNANELEELDVNPLFATQFGSIAVDALIVKRETP